MYFLEIRMDEKMCRNVYNLYISKSWSVAFIIAMFLLSHVSDHITYIFSIISLLFFYSFYLFINFVVYGYIFSNFSSSVLPFHFPTTININITLPLSLLSSFYFDYSYLHPLTINSLISHSIHILSHKKVITLFLSHVFLFFFC